MFTVARAIFISVAVTAAPLAISASSAETGTHEVLLSVIASARGASFGEIRKGVAEPIETSLRAVPGIEAVTTVSQAGQSKFLVKLRKSSGADSAQAEVVARLSADRVGMPAGTAAIRVEVPSRRETPIAIVSFTSHALPTLDLSAVVVWQLAEPLSTMNHITKIEAPGVRNRSINVALDQAQLATHGISMTDVAVAFRSSSLAPLQSSPAHFSFVDIGSALPDVEVVSNVVIKVVDGLPVRVRDLGQVELGMWPPEIDVRIDGQPAMLAIIFADDKISLADATGHVRNALAPILARIPAGIGVKVVYTCFQCLVPGSR